jgi:hypothetical protein
LKFAAIYARYSTDLQRDASIEDQIRLCRARIDQEGWTLVASYTDHAVSGSIRLRPGYQKLLEVRDRVSSRSSSPRPSTGSRATRRTWRRSTSICHFPV